MKESRLGLGVTVLGNKLFAIGGSDIHLKALGSMECLDLSVPDDAWTPVPPMTRPLEQVRVAVSGGKIYAMDTDDDETSMQCFAPNEGSNGQWTPTGLVQKFPADASFVTSTALVICRAMPCPLNAHWAQK